MEVDYRAGNFTTIDDLAPGGIFEFDGVLYMKIDSGVDATWVGVFDLVNNRLDSAPKNAHVKPLIGKLTIYEME